LLLATSYLSYTSLPSALKGFFSVAYFVPYLTSGVATSVFVRYFFSYSSPLNTWIRETFGVQISWFTEPEPAFWIIVAIIVWKVVGYYSLFLFAAMESVPKEIWEASALDGATGFRQFRKNNISHDLPLSSERHHAEYGACVRYFFRNHIY